MREVLQTATQISSCFSGIGPTLAAKIAGHENLNHVTEIYLEPMTESENQDEVKKT